jgi:predicted dehydrogenase
MALLKPVRPLRVAVIGVGRMGRRHAHVVSRLRDRGVGVTLAGVVDREPDRARAVATSTHALCRGSNDRQVILRSADAAIVAVPPREHFNVVQEVLNAGLDVLVEKPFCATLSKGEELCRIARSRGRLLQVGHVEWFNPAWHAAATLPEQPLVFDSCRTSQSVDHNDDVDAVHDLMIHDLHLIHAAVGEEPIELFATGRSVRAGTIDIARATLLFPGGCVARLLANRVCTDRTRACRIHRPGSMAIVDFVEQSVTVFGPNGTRPVAVVRQDALEMQFMAFLMATRSRRAGAVEGTAVLATMRTAQRISESLESTTRHSFSRPRFPSLNEVRHVG